MSEDLALRKKAIERIEALENAVKALLQAQKTREIEDNNEDMPQGEYFGIKFD